MSDMYNSYWDTYKKKAAYQEKIAKYVGEYLTTKYPNKPASGIKSMLSVGHGEGELDVPLLTDYLTGVTEYYGVDVRRSAVDMMAQNLSELSYRTFQSKFSNDYIQEYAGPPNKVDLILVGHVMYYVVEEFQAVVDKLLTWLSPGGYLILSHMDPVSFHFEIENILCGKGLKWKRFAEEKDRCKRRLQTEGWTVHAHHLAHSHDLSGPDTEVQLLLRLLLDVDPLPEEMTQINEVIATKSLEGTKTIPYNYEVSVIYKKS